MNKLLRFGILIALALIVIIPLSVQGEQGSPSIALTRASAEDLLLLDNTTLKGMEVNEWGILTSFNDIKEAGDGLESVYEQLDDYKQLESRYQATIADGDYNTYFILLMAGVGVGREDDLEDYMAELTLEDPVANADLISDLETLIDLEASFTEDDYNTMITIDQYRAYLMLAGMFEAFGIDSSDPSDQEIYDTFIYTMEIAPLSLQAALEEIQLSTEVLKLSLVSGMNSLYDTALSMEVTLELMYKSYLIEKNNAETSDAKLAIGYETAYANRQAHIKEEIALLEYEKMQRQLEALMYSFKEMLGIDPMVTVTLENDLTVSEPLQDIDVYLAQGLLERSEIVTLETDIEYKERELNTMNEWLYYKDEDVLEAQEDLRRLERDLDQAQKDVEEDIMKAYKNVLSSQLSLTEAEDALDIAERQYDEMEIRVDIGQMLPSGLIPLQLGVISAESNLLSAEINYRSAVTSLEYASGLGPSYQ